MLSVGRIISDRYEIMSQVGSGGMADVYKAQDLRLNRYVAIKVLKQEYVEDTNFITKFRGEAQSAAGLSHPNIVNVFDVGEDSGLYYIVMELVEGITLKKFIERKGKLELKEAVGIAIQIAQGMEAAHSNHIIHRDIKPQNIIISREGKVKVTDFGIARAATSNTITAGAMGSVHYISPEQARGGYSDEKSDIYSLGVTLYEMLSGTMPFAAENTVSVALLHIQEEATPLRELDPTIPVSIERVVQKCMQKKPERRYLTASELIRDLKRAITNPEGDFVQMNPMVNDSPTINLSAEELSQIKSARFSADGTTVAGRTTVAAATATRTTTKTNAAKGRRQVLDDDGDEIDPKIEKIMLFGGVFAIAILAVVIIVLVVKGFHLFDTGKPNDTQQGNSSNTEGPVEPGPGTNVNKPVQEDDKQEDNGEKVEEITEFPMPDLEGLTLEEAIDILEEQELSYRFDYEFHEEVEQDIIISHTPEAKTMVKKNTQVLLVVSNGETIINVPDVYNRLLEEAEEILTEAKLVVVTEEVYNDDLEAGRVISTNPERGFEAREGDEIILQVSLGPETKYTEVPDVVNFGVEEAEEILNEAHLDVNILYEYHDDIGEGLVISQDTAEGTTVEEGTIITIVVSLGEPEVTYTYVGSVTIDDPFPSGVESGYVVIKMDQDGKTSQILREGNFTKADFPMNIEGFTGSSVNAGIVYATVDGVLNNERIWYAQFIQVEE